MTNALACALVGAAALAAQAPPAASPPGDPARTTRAAANPAVAARDAARKAALAERVASLLPAALDDVEVTALAAALGLADAQRDEVEVIRSRYRDAVDARRTAAATALDARAGSAYEPAPGGDALVARPGPELAALLSTALEWRATLAKADDDLVNGLAAQRSATGAVGPGQARFARAVERDDLPASDPLAAVRLPDLLVVAGLADADRRAIEDALEPHWSRLAAAVTARRAAVLGAEAKAAALEATWGAAWRMTAAPSAAAEREAELGALDAPPAAAERALADANRAAIAALLRMLPSAAADRVRSTVDVAMWPSLWEPERSMAAALDALRPSSPPAVTEMTDAASQDVSSRLAQTRKELARRADAADSADAALEGIEPGQRATAAVAALEARRSVEELAERRRRIVADAVERMLRLLGDHPRQSAAIAALKAELDSAGRAAAWRLQGLAARIEEAAAPTGAPAPAAPAAGDGPASPSP